MPSSQQELIEQCKNGDQRSQLELYDNYCHAMFNIACRYLKNEEEAKDIMQESFLKAFSKLDSFVEKVSFGAWLKRIVINQCIDTLKKKKLETISFENIPLEITDDDDWSFDITITKRQIIDAIENTPKKYSLVLMLYLIEGYDHTEISEILNIAVKTSRTQLRRGKLMLKEKLKTKRYEKRY
ncbi:RNA polymerase sigma factor [Aureibaculum conchae]|uniref:RNA polymerase sigma factor n=1 Tax=Aureibaculum sp. 2308TA14-22 TaxID=3108392 RepID=UPI003392CBEF